MTSNARSGFEAFTEMYMGTKEQPSCSMGSVAIGPGLPPVFWPDIDVYFKRDTRLAFRLVEQLCEQGARFLKVAALHDAKCCLEGEHMTQYHVHSVGQVQEPYRAIIDRHVVPLEQLRSICLHARSLGMEVAVSVYDRAGIEMALQVGAAALKIPSSNIVHSPLIRAAASAGVPLVIDTGRSLMSEVDRAVSWAQQAGARNLLVQHSPPGPPAGMMQADLRAMVALGHRYGVPYGLSDHAQDARVLPLAAALGASLLEKGVSDDGAAADIDIAHALPISQVRDALISIESAYSALGHADLRRREGRAVPPDRMGIVASRALRIGERLGDDNVRFAFPAVGIPVERWDDLQGRKLVRAVPAEQPIVEDDLERP